MEVGWEDGVFERCVSSFVVRIDEGGEILKWRGGLRMGRDKFCRYLVGLSMMIGYLKYKSMAGQLTMSSRTDWMGTE